MRARLTTVALRASCSPIPRGIKAVNRVIVALEVVGALLSSSALGLEWLERWDGEQCAGAVSLAMQQISPVEPSLSDGSATRPSDHQPGHKNRSQGADNAIIPLASTGAEVATTSIAELYHPIRTARRRIIIHINLEEIMDSGIEQQKNNDIFLDKFQALANCDLKKMLGIDQHYRAIRMVEKAGKLIILPGRYFEIIPGENSYEYVYRNSNRDITYFTNAELSDGFLFASKKKTFPTHCKIFFQVDSVRYRDVNAENFYKPHCYDDIIALDYYLNEKIVKIIKPMLSQGDFDRDPIYCSAVIMRDLVYRSMCGL